MLTTKHFGARIQQRGILQSTIEMAQRYGFPKGDKIVLGTKQIDSAIKDLDQGKKDLEQEKKCLDKEKKNLLKARDQGGIVVVQANGAFITAYRVDSYVRSFGK